MAKAIPKWVQERLSKLWKEHRNKEMTYVDIENTLSPDEKTTIGVFLNELKKADWLEIKKGDDARKRIYTLKEPNKILQEITTK